MADRWFHISVPGKNSWGFRTDESGRVIDAHNEYRRIVGSNLGDPSFREWVRSEIGKDNIIEVKIPSTELHDTGSDRKDS